MKTFRMAYLLVDSVVKWRVFTPVPIVPQIYSSFFLAFFAELCSRDVARHLKGAKNLFHFW
jgi:hypothetical protein